jgi:MFS superfamily sulfate permease-like transporter
VSLIALPLGLGLAVASGAPPIAGIITAIVGGLVVSLFGGSYVTIAGAGKGLAVATLMAIGSLGAGDDVQGYYYVLAAIVISGALMFVLGLLRFGALSDFFPTTALNGLLASIGIIIISKSIHIMLGVLHPEAHSTLGLLAGIPDTIGMAWNGETSIYAVGVGLISLLIMILYNRIRIEAFHYFPAQLWVVILAVIFAYYYKWTGAEYPMDKEYLIDIPSNILAELSAPDFGMIATPAFWSAVLVLTVIASIESLSSIKAIDLLDPQKRRSNTNKDLRALGLATIISGALGGLNVVTAIASSSVNVTNGATRRISNAFHALVLLAFVLFLEGQLDLIPLPALAAILVHVGYKLASPEVFRKTLSTGREQLFILLVTIVATLSLGLISGLMIGMLVTLLVQLVICPSPSLILRNMFKQNVLVIEEKPGDYLITIRYMSNFINFIRLKNQLDLIPSSAHVVVDMRMAHFVDRTVMEKLAYYEEKFERKGGHFEVIGLDLHESRASHPFAARRYLRFARLIGQPNMLTGRQRRLKNLSREMRWKFKTNALDTTLGLERYPYFQLRRLERQYNVFKAPDKSILVLDLEYSEGEFVARESFQSTMMEIRFSKELPSFVIDPENLLSRLLSIAGFEDVQIEGHPDFNDRIDLSATDPLALREFLTQDVLLLIQTGKIYHMESNGDRLLVFYKERLASEPEIREMAEFGQRLYELIENRSDAGTQTTDGSEMGEHR